MKVVITSGGTREKFDPVRYIGNYSSGKMGAALAAAFAKAAEVVVVSGPVMVDYGCETHWAESAEEMLNHVVRQMPCDIFVGAAAVADRKPVHYSTVKIKKEDFHSLELVDNADIVTTVAEGRLRPGLVVAFAAESEEHVLNARAKLTKKSCDLVVVNDINAIGSDHTQVWLVGEGFEKKLARGTKLQVAEEIVKEIMGLYAEKHQD